MKKIVISIVAIFIALFLICFMITSSVKSSIQSKVDELNSNGFYVTNKNYSGFFKTKGKGKIEVSNASKAIEYFMNKKENSQMKDEFDTLLKLLSKEDKDSLINGLTFDYDFVVSNFSSKMNLNLYLTKLPIKNTYNLMKNSYAISTINEMLKNKEIQVNIDEKGKFKVSDFTFIAQTGGIYTVRGMKGDDKSLQISFIDFEIGNYYLDDKIVMEDINFFYSEDKNKKIDSKFDIGNLKYKNTYTLNEFDIKNLKISSFSIPNGDYLKGDTKISFDSLNFKNTDYYTKEDKNSTNLKNTSFLVAYDKLPYKEYKEFTKSLGIEAYSLTPTTKTQEADKKFFEVLAKSDLTININGESKDLDVDKNSLYKSLKLSGNLVLSKELDFNKIDILNDIFSVLKADIEIDKESVDKSLQSLDENLKSQLKFENASDENFKKLQVELKEDGLYTNGILTLPKAELKLFPNKYKPYAYDTNSSYDGKESSMDNVSYTYELVSPNLLRVNFKYKTGLKDVSSGGISVSFPQFKDDTRVKAKNTKTFEKLDVYKKGDTLYSGLLKENVTGEYLMIEGWDASWSDKNIEKEFSVDLDITDLSNVLEINLRGYSTQANKIDYELIPNQNQSFTQDQQTYPIKIADIDLYSLKNKKK
ncbi:hypothetical protein ACNSOS_02620 [Aliarcobacter vitoriensis]|uniref:hypothetical protein n=1 Tax=Aliarcobacter vitoriensis TaxID=2011099 RepID=UPI003AAFC47B